MKTCLLAFASAFTAFIALAASPVVALAAANPAMDGGWEGTLKVAGTHLRLVIKLKQADSGWTGTLDSPDQSAFGLPVEGVGVNGADLKLDLIRINASYVAHLTGDKLSGTWTQNGVDVPLEMKRTSTPPTGPKRPQEPKPPLPYDELEISVASPAPGTKLACTLTKPRGRGPFGGVALVTGSGPQDRNEALMGHKPFLVLADAITRKGVEVLRCDDRGIGKSTGMFAGATTFDFAKDALAEVAALRARPEVARAHVGVAGHSEGATVAAIAATTSKDVAFIVLLAGPALPGEQLLAMQGAWLEKTAGRTEQEIADDEADQHKAFAIVEAEKDDAAATKKLRALYDALPGEVRGQLEQQRGPFEGQIRQLLSPWFRAFLTLDPRTFLTQVKVPVLAINGERDRQVPAGANLPEMKKALKANHNATVREMPGLNHLFQDAKTGAPAEYGQIDETISPVALALVSDWIAHHGK